MEAKKSPPKKMGRPLKPIDWKKVELMCQIACTEQEIASINEVCIDTLYDRCLSEHGVTFSEFFKKHSDGGKMSMRRAQFKKALEGNPAMLIWMGKQMLGQKEQMEVASVQPIVLGYDPKELGKK
jgi:hypothetical protein